MNERSRTPSCKNNVELCADHIIMSATIRTIFISWLLLLPPPNPPSSWDFFGEESMDSSDNIALFVCTCRSSNAFIATKKGMWNYVGVTRLDPPRRLWLNLTTLAVRTPRWCRFWCQTSSSLCWCPPTRQIFEPTNSILLLLQCHHNVISIDRSWKPSRSCDSWWILDFQRVYMTHSKCPCPRIAPMVILLP